MGKGIRHMRDVLLLAGVAIVFEYGYVLIEKLDKFISAKRKAKENKHSLKNGYADYLE